MENNGKVLPGPVRLRCHVAARVDALAEKTGMDYSQIVHELVMYALDHAKVGKVTRLGLVFDGEVRHGDKP